MNRQRDKGGGGKGRTRRGMRHARRIRRSQVRAPTQQRVKGNGTKEEEVEQEEEKGEER